MVRKVVVPPDLIDGDADEGYGKVVDAFRANFAAHRDVGAAVAVYRDGVKVVDMWGGYRNGFTRTPWQQDTMVNMFSTTKGIASLAVTAAASRGLIDYDAKVADYWPQFAQAGKAEVTVRQLLSHQAWLSALDAPLRLADLTDQNSLSAALTQAAITPTGGIRDKVLHVDSMFSLGYCKPVPHFCFRSSGRAFGTPGLGGSFDFADPDTGVGFAYVMNRLGFHLWSDPRELALRQALFRDVLGAPPQK